MNKSSKFRGIGDHKLKHIALGSLTARSKDAVNGSQLYQTNQALAALYGTTYESFNYVNTSLDTVFTYLDSCGQYLNAINNSGAGVTFFHANSQLSDSEAIGVDSVAMGPAAIAQTDGSIAIGNRVKADGGRAMAIGSGSAAFGDGAVSLGDPNFASGEGAIALGRNNVANNDGAQGASVNNKANGAVAMGNQNKAVGQGSVALGNTSVAGDPGAVALGDTAAASSRNSVAMGSGSQANNVGDVALGANSTTQAAVGTAAVTINGQSYAVSGTNPTSTVSVGDVGKERTITNVAAGRVTRDSTDAVNGSELYATNQ
ncbi:MAG: Type IV fimbrial biogenesis protein PilY1, partial [uncultured Paraburkholderia sp.]